MYTELSIAATAIAILVVTVFIACIAAQFTGRRPDNNGLVMSDRMQPSPRKFTQNGWN